MKKVLLAVVGILFAATSFAQNALVASLSHGTSTTYFYGVTALQQAVNAAQSGDIINLSGGTFNAIDISKGITIRGAGIDSAIPTDINGNITINIPDEDDLPLMAEGIRFLGYMYMQRKASAPYCYFVRCKFKEFRTNPDAATITNLAFLNCKFTDSFYTYGTSSAYLQNSYINGMATYGSSSVTATNCIIKADANTYHGYLLIANSILTNCIFYYCGYGLQSTNQAFNCINVMETIYGTDIFNGLSQRTGCPTDTKLFTDVFKTFTGTYSDTETFELKDAAKTTYLGTDERQIGMYGGSQPYSSVPSYPLITTMTVGEQTDADGQLSVTIGTNK